MKNLRYAGLAALAVTALALSACGAPSTSVPSDGNEVLKVAAFEGGYGAEIYEKAVAAFEAVTPGVTVELKTSKTLPEELTPQIAAGDYPDVVILGTTDKAGLTRGFIRDRNLEDLTDVLDMTIPGEDVTVGSKLTEGIVGNLNTNPYADDQVYLMPLNASPTGLVYDAGLFEEKGWEVPTTFDEFFALGDQAKAEGISLFTYPTAGYLDSWFFALVATLGGEDFYRDVVTYKEDVWMSDKGREALALTAELLTKYTAPTTVGYANSQDFTKNQQSILDGTTLFMPNGTWIANEMKDGPRADNFSWALTTVPSEEPGAERYLTTFVESAWVPAEAEHKDLAKQFIAYLYSDEVAQIFATTGAVQPIKGLSDTLEGDAARFYGTYNEEGVEALVGGFAATAPVPGVDLGLTLFEAANGIIAGTLTLDDWQATVNDASNKLGAARD